jgi:hypothetical protein
VAKHTQSMGAGAAIVEGIKGIADVCDEGETAWHAFADGTCACRESGRR